MFRCAPWDALTSLCGVNKDASTHGVKLRKPISYVSMLGPKLMSKGGMVDTSVATANKKAILLYFSASWCGPCKQFTPMLMAFYKENKDKAGQEFEIVFVSSDHADEEFIRYYKDMPWLALPYDERSKQQELSKKHRVTGIPALVVLDADGRLCTAKGRDCVQRDPKAASFPWSPKTLHDVLKGAKGVTAGGEEYDLLAAVKGKITGLYFSAAWSPPCQRLTPVLVEAYKKLEAANKPFEVVFVSNDKTEKAFQEYFAGMPWLAVPYAEDALRDRLATEFDVKGVPTLVIADEVGQTLLTDAAEVILNDPGCTKYPWKPDVVDDLDGPRSGAALARDPVCVVIAPSELLDVARAAMAPVAREYLREAEKAGGEEPRAKFFLGCSESKGGAVGTVRALTGIQDPLCILFINLPSVFKCESLRLTERNVETFVADALASRVPARPIRRSALAALLSGGTAPDDGP